MIFKKILFALALCLLLAPLPALAETYTCAQQGFAVEVDPAYTAQWEDGNGVVIYTQEPGYIPYAIVWCAEQGDMSDYKVESFFARYTQGIRTRYGDALQSVEEGIALNIGGESIPGARYTYDLNGYTIELMVFLQVTGDSARQFTAKYVAGQGDATVAAMAQAVESFTLRTSDESVGNPAKASAAADVSARAQEASGFEILPISWEGVHIGKMAVPTGYIQFSEVHCSDEQTCMGSPLRINLTAMSEDGSVTMSYQATETYLDRVSTAYGFLKAEEGALDPQTATFQKRYLNAAAYCDERAAAMNAAFWKEESIAFYDAMVNAHERVYAEAVLPNFMKKEWHEVTAAERVYTYEAGGRSWAMCIAAEVRGLQYSISYGSKETVTVWELPGGVFTLICPLEAYEQLHSGAFAAFMQNTAVTDTFFALQEELSNQIRDRVIDQMNMVTAQSMAYAAAMDSFRSESVNAYLASSSYDTAARFSDYLFDQNTYTTSDGCEVSISTAYDYVWEGSNGRVYYSQYASDMPYGATQLSHR